MRPGESFILAGDIGGTKSDLAVFAAAPGRSAPIAEATYPSRRFSSLGELVRAFLRRLEVPIACAGFGVAGPVAGGAARLTNLPWELDAGALAAELGVPRVHLFNDVEALAASVPRLTALDLETLQRGAPRAGGTIALLAAGTGLGEAFLVWDGRSYRAFPSEGGHADFAPADGLQTGLLAHLAARFGHVSWERVCSGSGLPNIYGYLKERGSEAEPMWLAERLAAAADPTPVIIAAAADPERPGALCREALSVFVAALGAEAGNLALKVLATGGLYLGGGIPRRIRPALRAGGFLRAFREKGRMAPLLGAIPVHVIVNPKAALIGAAALAAAAAKPPRGRRAPEPP